MDRVKLEVRYRDNLGKHHIKALRREGYVPGSLYGKDIAPVPIEVKLHSLAAAVKTDAGVHAIIDIKVVGGPKEANGPGVIKEIQKDYLGRHIVHVALQQVSMKERFTAPVSVVLHGQPIGVSRDAGLLEQVLNEVEVKSLPASMPPHFDIDISDWEIGRILHARDIPMPEGVELTTDPDAVVAMVRAPHIQRAAEAEGEVAVEAPVEQAPAAEAETEE